MASISRSRAFISSAFKRRPARTLVWQANREPDVAGYRVVWRDTTAADWQGSQFVGNVTEAKIPLSKDNVFFGVQAVDKDGNVSPATYPSPQR